MNTPTLNRRIVSLEKLAAMRYNGGGQRLMEAVGTYYGYTSKEILSRSRPASLAWTRQVAMWCAYKLLESYADVGRLFARHHSDVMYAVERVEHERQSQNTLSGTNEALRLATAALQATNGKKC